jgi:diaminopimelate epimerase
MELNFTKMEGLGNDYIYVDATREDIRLDAEQIAKLSDRNFGIGSDGVIFIRPSKVADFQMDMYNSDGSSSEMCGNGIRCVAKYIYDHKLTDKKSPSIETGKGVLTLDLQTDDSNSVNQITVNMGAPILKPSLVPVQWKGEEPLVAQMLPPELGGYSFTAVSMGNPHCVIFVEDADKVALSEIGPKIENHPMFPRRTNVEFVSSRGKDQFYQRTWERGAGETLACGTGACSVLVAAVLNHKSSRKATIILKGGPLHIEWTESGDVLMTGPAREVFAGKVEV